MFFRKGDRGTSEHFTVSWLPCSGEIRALAPQAGCNYTFEETTRFAGRQTVGYWGPVSISRAFYEEAKRRTRGLLHTGVTQYKMVDDKTRRARRLHNRFLSGHSGGWANCIHAVSDIGGRYLPNGSLNQRLWGEPASYAVLTHLSRVWRFSLPSRQSMKSERATRLELGSLLDQKP